MRPSPRPATLLTLAAFDLLAAAVALHFGYSLPFALAAACLATAAFGAVFFSANWLTVAIALIFQGAFAGLLQQHLGASPLLAATGGVVLSWLTIVCLPPLSRWSASDPAPWPGLAISLLVCASLWRALYAGSIELLPEETYYWSYSQHLDLSYLDHPPMIAWLIAIGTSVFGNTEFGVRVGGLLCGALTTFFAYRLARNVFGREVAIAACAATQVLPFFFLAGMLVTPDAPLTAAWAASLFFLERALIAGQARAWLGFGVSLGIGLLSKYSILLLGPAVFAFMCWDRDARQWWRRPQPYLAVIIAALLFSPVIIWNAQHQWASFAFQTARRIADVPHFTLHRLILSALLLITPIGVLAVASMMPRAAWPRGADTQQTGRQRHLLLLAVLCPLAVFALFSLRREVKLDWTGAPWTAALPLLAASMLRPAAAGVGGWVRSAWPRTLIAVLILLGAGFMYLSIGWPGTPYSARIELLPVGWRDAGRRVMREAQSYRERTGSEPVIVGMDRYAVASEIAFYGRTPGGSPPAPTSVHLFEGVGLMYERWAPAERFAGRALLLVGLDPRDLDTPYVKAHVGSLDPIQQQDLERFGVRVRPIYFRFAYDYRR